MTEQRDHLQDRHREMQEMMQQFLIRKRGTKQKAHIWDTLCRMASTGGLKLSGYSIRSDTFGHEICKTCLAAKGAGR